MITKTIPPRRRRQITPASQPGMGAILYDQGTAFRVWAPNADQVFVSGDFNEWSETAGPLASEGNGYWSADIPGAKAGDEYRFLIINGEQKLWRIDPYARQVTNSVGNSVIYDPRFDWGKTQFQMPPWNKLVIYEMHIGTFHDKPGGPAGTFDSAVKRLKHVHDLGVNAVQLMPPMEFPGGFSWGYNPSHPFAVESDYGGPTALKKFVKAAHELGIAVLLDVVYNHFGPSDLDLWVFDGWQENGKGGIYFYNDDRATTPWGDTRPDYGRPEVRQYLFDNAIMWLDEYRIDGLRFDATAFIRNVHGNEADPANDLTEGWALLQWINREINSRYPGKITIAEDLRQNAWITKEPDAGGAGFGAQWDGEFVHPVRAALISRDDKFRDIAAVAQAVAHRYNGDAFERVIYTESHDEVANGKARLPEEIWPGNAGHWFAKKRSTLGAALVMTTPGIPMLFQGQEFLADKWFEDQAPLDWSEAKTYRGITDLYRDLIHLRGNASGQTRGLCSQHVQIYHVNDETKLLAFHRWDQGGPGDSVVVVLNMTSQPYENYNLGFPREGVWRVRFNSDWNGYDDEYGNYHTADVTAVSDAYDGLPCRGSLSIGPYTAVILSQDD